MSQSISLLIYFPRRDLRLSDNPILHDLAASHSHGFTHFLPVYVLPAHQMELSGLLVEGKENPYPPARSRVGDYWRCGPHRARFICEAVWNLKDSFESIGSGLTIFAGTLEDVLKSLCKSFEEKNVKIGAVWMTSHEGVEEKRDEKAVRHLCETNGFDFKLWVDEKYFIDDRDVGLENRQALADIFTSYRKSVEPLRTKPRAVLPTPPEGSLPKFPGTDIVPSQIGPFIIPDSLDKFVEAMVSPVQQFLPDLPAFPKDAKTAHPFKGGEVQAQARLKHLIEKDNMKNYKDTRNGLIGTEFSTKLSAFLALGCVTARQIHHTLVGYEDGTDTTFEGAEGYGAGENEGTAAIRFELLWRDYMRLCHQKFGQKLFRLEGFRSSDAGYGDDEKKMKWKSPLKERASPDQDPSPESVAKILERFVAGTTGMGLIDASQRELLHTGYTSNRARQNVASFLAKHLGIDWRYGAEWYEMLLIDYDVSSNWANWQYVSGVGNDPRGELRIFNPVKQAFDYDKEGKYVRAWVPELAGLEKLENLFQAWTASEEDLKAAGLQDNIMVTDPVKRIQFSVDGKPARPNKRPFFRRRGQRGGADGPAGTSEGKAGGGREVHNGVKTSPNPDVNKSPRGLHRGGGSYRGSPRGGRGGGVGGGYRGHPRGGYFGGRGGGFRGRSYHGPHPGQVQHWQTPIQPSE